MKRVLLLGRGGAGKSTFARALSDRTGLPVIELDKAFWRADLTPMEPSDWAARQQQLAAGDDWIMDGDLGKYDVLAARLPRADTVILLDLPLLTCVSRALKRSRERLDFWYWTITWRVVEKPKIMNAVKGHAPSARLIVIRSQKEADALIAAI